METKQTTFAEENRTIPVNGESAVVNWYAELTKDQIDWQHLSFLSGNWVSCACGNQCAVIPRKTNGQPKDLVLARLGSEFYSTICSHNSYRALEILHLIEIRSAELIEKIQDGSKTKKSS